MGNNNSQINSKENSKSKPLPALSYDEERTLTRYLSNNHDDEERTLTCYLSNNHDDVDRHHMYHFLKNCLFQNHFSSPIEDRIAQGECKVLDIG